MDNPTLVVSSPLAPLPVAPAPVLTPKNPILPILITILVLFLLSAVGLLAYQNWTLQQQISTLQAQPTPAPSLTPTPTTDPTANWNTYTNSQFGFTFKYPKDMDGSCCSIGMPNGQPLLVLAKKSTVRENTDKPFDGLALAVSQIGDQSFEQFVESQKSILISTYKELDGSAPKNTNSTTVAVDKKQGILLRGYSIFKTEYLYVPFSNTKYVLALAKTEESSGSFDEEFDLILSTFKFLNKTEVGVLEASVIRSPTCAGPQRPGEICEAPVASETFNITKLSDNEIIQTVRTDKDGKFTISLAPGTYKLQSTTSGIGKNIRNPDFTIAAGKIVTQRFDVDTGIR